ncbi:MAG: hypothetical protein RR280_08745 [Bacteroidaceae bacterium]
MKKEENENEVRRGRAIDFLGYCFTPENVRLRKRIKQNFSRKLKSAKSEKRKAEIRGSYKGWCKWCDGKHLWTVITHTKMSFAEKGIKASGKTKDGKKFFDVPNIRLMDILNVPICVLDFEKGVSTKQGEDRYCVLFEKDGKRYKFITNCYNIKDVLDMAREKETEENELVFPVDNVIVRRRSIGDGKSAYYFED